MTELAPATYEPDDEMRASDKYLFSKPADSAVSSAHIYAGLEPEQAAVPTAGFGSPAAASPIVNPSKLDFDVTQTSEPKTPNPTVASVNTTSTLYPLVAPVRPSAQAVSAASTADVGESELDYNQFIRDTLLWTNPVRSTFYLTLGSFLILSVNYMLGHNIPVVIVVCRLTLLQMAMNFLRSSFYPHIQQKATWLDSAWTAAAISQLAGSIKSLAAVHDKHLTANSPQKHFKIVLFLWALSLISRVISPSHLALVLYVSAFVLPKMYYSSRQHVDQAVSGNFQKAKVQYDAADKRVLGVVTVAGILGLGCISTLDLITAAFVLCVLARAQLPKEVNDLSKKVAPVVTPLGNAAANIGGQFSRIIDGAAQKFELTPTPKKKRM